KLGFPVVVKPNGGSQGKGVAVVRNKREFYRAMREVFRNDKIGIVQEKISGRDYRVVVLDDKIISAYERVALNVLGDGKSTILKLLKDKQREFIVTGRDTQIAITDPRIKEKLLRNKLSFKSIPKKGERVFLLDNANLSTGGDSVDITEKVHPEFKKIAVNITRDMGLRLCGVDLMIQGTIEEKPKVWWVVETNAAPGLDHYVKIGKRQEKIVEDLYLEVLKAIST
ncbi:MAG TPA: ATP-grasp domain-containing protein, partial [Candidatus Paceibacterota bacterium]|nr:ATP-grasp domain-containing protein [Candidatus Paceibacterota bacterium]